MPPCPSSQQSLQPPDPSQPSPSHLILPEPNPGLEQRLSRVVHPSLIRFHSFFRSEIQASPVFFAVHAFYPNSQTLESKYGLDPRKYAHVQPQFIPEDTLWNFILQLVGALNAIHSSNFASKAVHPSKILVTGKNRIRLAGFGLADALMLYDSGNPTSLRHAQFEDVYCVGKVILQLATQSSTAVLQITKALDSLSARYSPQLREFVTQLLSKTTFASACDIHASPLLAPRLWAYAEGALTHVDQVENVLERELENGRLARLLIKLGFVNERPSYEMDSSWSETGDRFLLKLFRDYVFHQEDESQHAIVDYAHVVSCLNKLDVGSSEKIVLVSRDGVSMVVASFAEIRRCLEGAMLELNGSHSDAFASAELDTYGQLDSSHEVMGTQMHGGPFLVQPPSSLSSGAAPWTPGMQ